MNKELINARKQNMKIYSIYRAISLDLIFYYAIEFLFLTQVKNITPSEVVLSTSFYAVFMIFLQIPASIFIDKVGTKKCTILANVFNVAFVLLIMNVQNVQTLIFAQFISSLCFSLKDISDEALLEYSIPDTKRKSDIFSKLEGKGFQKYFLINAITSVFAGSLYVINPYIPIVAALLFTVASTIMAFGFKDIEEIKKEQIIAIITKNIFMVLSIITVFIWVALYTVNYTIGDEVINTDGSISYNTEKKKETHHYFKELKEAFSFIIKSQRLRSLFLYSGITWGTFCLISTYRNSVLVDIGTRGTSYYNSYSNCWNSFFNWFKNTT